MSASTPGVCARATCSRRSRQLRGAWSVLALCALLELPSVVQPDRLSLSGVRVPGDALLIAGVLVAARGTRAFAVARAALAALAFVLVLYRVDAAACRVLMRHPPVLYDQAFLLRHLGVLLVDLWGAWAWLAALGGLLLLAGSAWLVRRLLDAIATHVVRPHAVRARAALAGGALALVAASAFDPGAVRFRSLELARDLLDARELARRIARGIERSPYRAYEGLALARKPNVYVFFVESYGRVLASDPSTSESWRAALAAMQRALAADGYRFASAFSRAPVSGGRSWLAHASVFSGTHVAFEALYQRLFADGRARVPHLPGFLRSQGYRTVLLAPADRARPGVTTQNPYGYEQAIRFAQLGYPGPYFGWGRVPDQYSLAYAQQRVFGRGDRPLFFVFTMVSSHAPWRDVPAIVGDALDPRAYRQLKLRTTTPAAPLAQRGDDHGTIVNHTRRYSRDVAARAAASAGSALRQAYARSVTYDLALLQRALPGLHGDDLIVVLGDHQPPLLSSERDDFAAPVHAFARDPRLLQELYAHGFAPTLALDPHAPAALPHEALFSLLVRALLRADGAHPDARLPPFLPNGVRLAD